MRYELTDDERACHQSQCYRTSRAACHTDTEAGEQRISQRCDKEKRQDNNYAGVAHRRRVSLQRVYWPMAVAPRMGHLTSHRRLPFAGFGDGHAISGQEAGSTGFSFSSNLR